MHLVYSVVKADQTGQYYTHDPLEALGDTGRPLVTCHQAINMQGQTFLVLPGNNRVKVEVRKSGNH